MKKIFLFALLSLSISALFSQKLTLRTTFFGYGYQQGDKKLSISDVRDILKENNMEANVSILDNAKLNIIAMNVLGIGGGAMVGWEIGELISGQDVNEALFAGGIAAVILSYICDSAARKGLKKVASDYNTKNGFGLSVQPSKNGLGLVVNF